MSSNDLGDDEALADMLEQVESELEQVSGDGVYDKRKCYEAIEARGAIPVILPRHDALLWSETDRSEPHPRNQAIARIEAVGRSVWKQESHYHRRSLTETPMDRFKTIFGGTLRRRRFDNQAVEILLKCAELNQMIQLGEPESYKVDN